MKIEREKAMTVKPDGGTLDVRCSNCGKEMTFAHHMKDGRYLCHECEKTERACPECGGEGIDVKREIDGNLFGYKCQSCNGTGVKEREAGE